MGFPDDAPPNYYTFYKGLMPLVSFRKILKTKPMLEKMMKMIMNEILALLNASMMRGMKILGNIATIDEKLKPSPAT